MVGKKLKIGRIEIDRELCISAASCVAVAPDVFDLDGENKAVLAKPKKASRRGGADHRQGGASAEAILLAAQSCPTRAIKIFDEKGKRIFP